MVQVHYNLLATNGKPGATDQSRMRLRLMPGTADVTPLVGILLPSQIEPPCTARESGPLCDRAAAVDDLVRRTGADARAEVDGLSRLCNQGRPDASLRSKIPQLKTMKPRYVVWGDGASDEMCLAILTVTPKG